MSTKTPAGAARAASRTLLARARERQALQQAGREDDRAARDRVTRRDLAAVVDRILELRGDDRLAPEALARVVGGPALPWGIAFGSGLYAFERDGLRFLVGSRGVLAGVMLAVRVGDGDGDPAQWPPPEGERSAFSGWAPTGYRSIRRLADLAVAVGTIEEATQKVGYDTFADAVRRLVEARAERARLAARGFRYWLRKILVDHLLWLALRIEPDRGRMLAIYGALDEEERDA